MPVAAAATVPRSSTMMTAWWTTSVTRKRSVRDIREKSAWSENASARPRRFDVPARPAEVRVVNRGIDGSGSAWWRTRSNASCVVLAEPPYAMARGAFTLVPRDRSTT